MWTAANVGQGKSWPNLISMSLRNELRIPLTGLQVANDYNWEQWYAYVRQGADAIHSANPDVLIFLSGLDSDRNLTTVVQGAALEPGTDKFSHDDFQGYGNDKLVLELHAYDNIMGTPSSNCSVTTEKLFEAGFQTLTSSAVNQFPLVVTEFSFPQNTAIAKDPYASCLLEYFPSQRAGWMIWSLSGSYYTREGIKDYDEEWSVHETQGRSAKVALAEYSCRGLLTHDWTSWRSPDFINTLLSPAVKASMAPISDDGNMSSSDDSPNDKSPDKPNSATSMGHSHTNMLLMMGAIAIIAVRSCC
jgi:hypothetical protein